jgi:hypothetical protein
MARVDPLKYKPNELASCLVLRTVVPKRQRGKVGLSVLKYSGHRLCKIAHKRKQSLGSSKLSLRRKTDVSVRAK